MSALQAEGLRMLKGEVEWSDKDLIVQDLIDQVEHNILRSEYFNKEKKSEEDPNDLPA